jgi:hypothetical protein
LVENRPFSSILSHLVLILGVAMVIFPHVPGSGGLHSSGGES